MAALAELGVLAHGGVYGAIGEGLLAVAIAAFFVAVWLRERKRGERAPAELNDEELS